ncbi:transforming growth factor beta-1-induced transcript 1 protein isoform X2 [Tribolium castaneum]|nr:PREDICTED: transforming growth factor beta-1-induced transcript 1 protein isoform X2 [Tribolium castaneum]|eukprot:XP_008194630.1 PREDICTED: transforming growth factor beta-1-induced transcript 1 protein isoform X2 [Tribolium castaneum]
MAMAPPKVCASCKQNIEGGPAIIALDKVYHPEHFTCHECKAPITGSKFQEKDNEPYCDKCYADKFLTRCKACGDPITDKVVTAMGADWHEDHFVCGGCKAKLIGTKFMEIENAPYCQKCYTEKYADKCKACGKPIVTQAVVALDAKWHQLCFKCSKCGKPIMKDQSFRTEGGKPQCVKC